jgi:hypothetical protein
MKIREYQEDDFTQLVDLAKQHNINLPPSGMVNVAEDDAGKIIGTMLIRLVPTIEPFICTNPIASKKLFDVTFNQAREKMIDMNILRCYANQKNVETYKKLGFYEIFKNYSIMEKGL